MSNNFIKDLKKLKLKVLESSACLGDMIQDEKKFGKTLTLKKYKHKAIFWTKILVEIENMIKMAEKYKRGKI